MPIVEKIKGKAKEVYNHGCGFVKDHPYKTAATFVAIATAISLTAAYFLSPAYATFVGTSVAKAATLVSPAITAMSALAVAHPLVASLVVLAAVAVLVTAAVLVCKNNDKATQIENQDTQIKCMENQVAKIKEAVFDACEKEDNKPKVDNGKLTLANDKDPSSVLYGVAEAVGLVKAQVK